MIESKLSASEINVAECHGTGTALGDQPRDGMAFCDQNHIEIIGSNDIPRCWQTWADIGRQVFSSQKSKQQNAAMLL